MQAQAYLKAIAALVVAVIAALITALGTGTTDFGDLDAQTWLIALATVLASGALVWWTENIQGIAGGIIKAVVGALGAAIAALIPALDDKVISNVEWLTALSAFVVGLAAVYQIPNAIPEEAAVVPTEPAATSTRVRTR
jgi:hypothetical protein